MNISTKVTWETVSFFFYLPCKGKNDNKIDSDFDINGENKKVSMQERLYIVNCEHKAFHSQI